MRKSFCLVVEIIGRSWPDWLRIATIVTLALAAAWPVVGAAPALQFNRDIRPILAENCLACHGPDNGSRKAGLRLDTKDGMFERTPKHEPAVVPGSLEKSELWRRITTTE